MSRNLGLDFLRVVAILTVVLTHTSTSDLSFRDNILCFLPSANACFAFLAGWFLFKSSETGLTIECVGHVIIRRTQRLVIPYLLWEMIYVLMNIGFDFISNKLKMPTMREWIDIVFWGSGSVQLWFIITLAYVQIAQILVFAAIGKLSFKWRAMIFIALSCISLVWFANGIDNVYLRRLAFLLGYSSLGVVFRLVLSKVKSLYLNTFCLCGMLVGVIIVIVSHFFQIPQVISVLAWCLMFGCMPIHVSCRRMLTLVASTVMGIYLSHVLFTRIIGMATPSISKLITNEYLIVLINATVGFISSFLFVYLLRKTRVRWVVNA
jgi:surface polysaccharide O-acyltransferase-like enzyme